MRKCIRWAFEFALQIENYVEYSIFTSVEFQSQEFVVKPLPQTLNFFPQTVSIAFKFFIELNAVSTEQALLFAFFSFTRVTMFKYDN